MDSGAAIGPTLKTARLILRPPVAEDLEPRDAVLPDPLNVPVQIRGQFRESWRSRKG